MFPNTTHAGRQISWSVYVYFFPFRERVQFGKLCPGPGVALMGVWQDDDDAELAAAEAAALAALGGGQGPPEDAPLDKAP